MKKKLNKKTIIISIFIVICLITLSFLLIGKNKVSILDLKKYRQNIIINLYGEEEKNINIDVTHDGSISKIMSNYIDKTVYYKNNEILYREGAREIVAFETPYSYTNIYSYFKNSPIDKKNNTLKASPEAVQKFFKNFYLDLSVKNDTTINFVLEKGYIQQIFFESDLSGKYKNITVDIIYERLDDEYKINPNDLTFSGGSSDSNVHGAILNQSIKMIKAEENILDLTKIIGG